MQLDKFKKRVRRILQKIQPTHKSEQDFREARIGDLATFICKDRRISNVPLVGIICDTTNFSHSALVHGDVYTFGREFYDVVSIVQSQKDSYNKK